MALGRLSILKSSVLLNISNSTWDDELSYLLRKSTRSLNAAVNRELELTTYEDEYYTPIQKNRILLNEHPVQTLVSVKFWNAATEAWETESLDYIELVNKRYIDYPKRGESSNSTYSGFPVDDRNSIKITYTGGYITSGWNSMTVADVFGVPEDLEWACCAIASIDWALGRQDKGLLGIQTKSFGAESITYESFERGVYPDKVMTVIDRYRRRPILK